MTYGHAWLIARIVSLVLIGIYLIAGAIGIVADFDSTRDTVFWLIFLWGGAVLMYLGNYVLRHPPMLSASLVSIGAAAGGLALFWTFLVPLAAAVVIALSFALARRPTAPA
jgi:hypothetical protein